MSKKIYFWSDYFRQKKKLFFFHELRVNGGGDYSLF